MADNPPLERRRFDTLILGAGGAGLRAALQLSDSKRRVAVVSKVFPTRSHDSATAVLVAVVGFIASRFSIRLQLV
ncbi:MAG: FAD-binding protein [gamma proteobacterium symbiont of Bathyaustriella thionipta]|nr:FAD-binding protein [gamma proteobacterium symbiont of Bathyaustriella thionipta]